MKRILILGSSGLIGHQIYNFLSKKKNYKVFGLSKKNKVSQDSYLIDALNTNNLSEIISKIKPEIIVNAIGLLISESDANPQLAYKLNAELPLQLSGIAINNNARLIHISTDCVFSGKKGVAYTESDLPDGSSVYARTKTEGEKVSENHLVIRTSVIGPELSNRDEELFNWFMNQTEEIEGYKTAIWSGITTLVLAENIEKFFTTNITGIYHLASQEPISKYLLLELLAKYFRNDIFINPVNKNDLNKSLLNTRKGINLEIPKYNEMIYKLHKSMLENKDIYSHYQL